MANLTITVDEGTLKRARIQALEEDTSVNADLREYLEEYAGGNVLMETGKVLEEALGDLLGHHEAPAALPPP